VIDRFLRLINVYETEVKDVLFSVYISFTIKFLSVVGWSFLVIYFVQLYGFAFLVNLFLTHGIAMILGYFLFRNFFTRFKLNSIFAFLVALMSLCLLVLPFLMQSQILFITLVFISFSLLLNQIKIAKNLFVEDLFSPIQSTRIFPIVESSETIAIIFAGLFVSLFAKFFTFENIFFLCAFFTACLIPIIILHHNNDVKQDFNHLFEFNSSVKDSVNETNLSVIKYVVFFQVLFFIFLEFQYLFLLNSSHGSSFAYELGMYHMIFGSVAILFQLFVASKILRFLGIVKSMMVSPISLLVLTVSNIFTFNFLSILILKTNQELSNILHYNAYHSSYYAFDHNSRIRFMELNESVFRPLALIIGALFILLTRGWFVGYSYLSIFMILALGSCLYFGYRFRKAYDEYPILEIKDSSSDFQLLNALFILEQNFKHYNIPFLINFLLKNNPSHSVSSKVVAILTKFPDLNYLDSYINLLNVNQFRLPALKIIRTILINCAAEIDDLPITRSTILNLYNDLLVENVNPNVEAEVLCFKLLANSDLEQTILRLNEIINESNCELIYETLISLDDPMAVKFFKDSWDRLPSRARYFALRVFHKFQPCVLEKYIFELYKSERPLDFSYLLVFLLNKKFSFEFSLKHRNALNLFLYNLYMKSPHFALNHTDLDELRAGRFVWSLIESKKIINAILNDFYHYVSITKISKESKNEDIYDLRDMYSIIGRQNEVLFLNTVLEQL